MVSDEILVQEVATGSRDAFEELVRRHQQRISRLAWTLTRGDADVDDLVQETFIRAHRALGRFRRDCTFRTWVQRIALNVINSHLARRTRRSTVLTLWSEVETDDRVASRCAVHDDLETSVAQRQMINRALASLSDDVRVLLMLRDIHGLAYQEIATFMGLPIGTVESRVFRAHRRLRLLLAPLRSETDCTSPDEDACPTDKKRRAS